MKKDINHILIRTSVKKALNDIHTSQKRGVRNLIDLGLNFSKGRFQKNFLQIAQTMLHDEKSAYYDLIKNSINNIDEETLITFGINIGYNSCTKGANTIRTIEAEDHCNIPWALTLVINQEKLNTNPCFYSSVIQQGMELGIYSYFLFIKESPEQILPLLQEYTDCAFIVFLRGHLISDSFIHQMQSLHNTMLAIYDNEERHTVCAKLKEAKLLYSVYLRYTEQDKDSILSGKWLSSILESNPIFAILLPNHPCQKSIQQEIYNYILSIRTNQQYPIFFADFQYDQMTIDQIISNDICIVGFNEHGNLYTFEELYCQSAYNLFEHNLKEILCTITKQTSSL